MASEINKNRYRLVTLLYVIFVCLSVLNIPSSLLDSNKYAIKTLEYQEKQRYFQVQFANKIIDAHQQQLAGDTTKIYLEIRNRIHQCYSWIDSADEQILKKLAAQKTDIYQEFNSRRKMEAILLEDSLLSKMQKELFALESYLGKQKYRIDTALKSLIPLTPNVLSESGKETSWDYYLFLHKPTAISYFQLKRIKLLLLDHEFIYQNAALKTIDYLPAYYSKKENRVFLEKADAKPELLPERPAVQEIKQDPIPVKQAVASLNKQTEKQKDFDNLFQNILSGLHTENLYVGIANPLLNNFAALSEKDFSITIDPAADISVKGNDYFVIFKKTGDFVIRFVDKRDAFEKLIFEKKIRVTILPNPSVRLNIENGSREQLSPRDLLSLNRLMGTMEINGNKVFPGRINGYRVTKIAKSGEQLTAYNYGEVFQPAIQGIISKLQRGDLLLFDNVTASLLDGTTRTPSPLLYKIID